MSAIKNLYRFAEKYNVESNGSIVHGIFLVFCFSNSYINSIRYSIETGYIPEMI